MVTKAILQALKQARQREWDKTYWAFDIHNTMIVPNYEAGNIPTRFYPHALETMQLISKRTDIVRILYTCSHPEEIEQYIKFFKENDVHFDHVNNNPDVKNTTYGCYQDKMYFNVLFEDKAGFDPNEDWIKVKEFMLNYPVL